MRSTDKTIEIECSECGDKEVGVKAMENHILLRHMNTYDSQEAAIYARHWADAAYDKGEEFEESYAKTRKEEDRDD